MRRYKLLLNFSDWWVRRHTSNHLCLPSRDWPIFWIRNFVSLCWPISAGQSGDGRQGWLDVWGRTQQSERNQQEFITPHLKLPSCISWLKSKFYFCTKSEKNVLWKDCVGGSKNLHCSESVMKFWFELHVFSWNFLFNAYAITKIIINASQISIKPSLNFRQSTWLRKKLWDLKFSNEFIQAKSRIWGPIFVR